MPLSHINFKILTWALTHCDDSFKLIRPRFLKLYKHFHFLCLYFKILKTIASQPSIHLKLPPIYCPRLKHKKYFRAPYIFFCFAFSISAEPSVALPKTVEQFLESQKCDQAFGSRSECRNWSAETKMQKIFVPYIHQAWYFRCSCCWTCRSFLGTH